MPIDSHHPEFDAWLPKWEKCRDAAEGQECVHDKGVRYLPKLSEQSMDEYNAYRGRALYYNATGRTVDGLSGLGFRRPPVFEVPASLEYLEDDVDTSGTPLLAFCERAVEEVITTGRVGILADFPPMQEARTLADEEASGARPYLCLFKPESIVNWQYKRIANRMQLSLVVLAEKHEQEQDDGYTTKAVDQLRALRLIDGVYVVEIHRKLKTVNGETWQLVEAIVPKMNGNTIPFIPFLMCGPMGVGAEIEKPPILDLANVNLSHYKTSADYEHGLHFTGLPTPVVSGHTFDTGDKLALGSTSAIGFPSADAKAYYLEFQGQGLSHLSKRLEEKEAMMAALGARMLAAEKRQVETAETAAIHRSGENSVLASLAIAVSGALSKALGWCGMWAGVQEEVEVELNTDYLPSGMTPQELTALVGAWQAGGISAATLYENLQRGEIARQGVEFEDEKAAIEEEGPKPGAMVDPMETKPAEVV